MNLSMNNRFIRRKAGSLLALSCFFTCICLTGCSQNTSASNNSRMQASSDTQVRAQGGTGSSDASLGDSLDISSEDASLMAALAEGSSALATSGAQGSDAVMTGASIGISDISGSAGDYTKGTSHYYCDPESDAAKWDGNCDIVVGDNLYATQINDWYQNFADYEGKVVEIEGYYIDEFSPYLFVGRYGPSCPYCNGGYVSFEFFTDDTSVISILKNASSWIKVIGALQKGKDISDGNETYFYYIEVLKLEVEDEAGVDTVTS